MDEKTAPKLPEPFVREMEALLTEHYGAEDFQNFLASYGEEPKAGLRLNRRKLPSLCLPKDLAGEAGLGLRKIPWADNGCYCAREGKPARHPYYYAGLYYIQEPSAMIPASILPVRPGERVLDLCAAPGGKATELGARLAGRGVLYANDISHSRAKALLKNLEMAGIPNLFVTSEDPQKLLLEFPEQFDQVLIDAPCSGEGMFRRDPSLIRAFQERGPEEYVPVQRGLLEAGAGMLAPGGFLVYSTCTFSVEENEGNILAFLARHPEFEVAVPENLQDVREAAGLREGFGIPQAVRVWPHGAEGEGHFAVLLHKRGQRAGQSLPDTGAGDGAAKRQGRSRDRDWRQSLPAGAADFFRNVTADFGEGTLFQLREQLYLLPEGEKAHRNIRYVRTGLLLGSLSKSGAFEPSQALAMALAEEEYPSGVTIPAGDVRAVKYLKGETLELDGLAARGADGWTLVSIGGFPAGWGKRKGNTLKNKYYPGWRWQ